MSKAQFIREAHLARLQGNIAANQKRYTEGKPWLTDYFGSESWSLQSSIDLPDGIKLLAPSSKEDLLDLENTKFLYLALRHLTPLQAADDRLWTYLTHVTFWDYMRARWPAEQYIGKPRVREVIQERYFFMPDKSRALTRNGIARLWWYGHVSYDEGRDDPFELTAALLKHLDVTASILERAFSKNPVIVRTLLSALVELEKAGKPFYVREKVRSLAKFLVQLGGVTIIDALDPADIKGIVLAKIDQLSAAA